jgi:hypothetical protein
MSDTETFKAGDRATFSSNLQGDPSVVGEIITGNILSVNEGTKAALVEWADPNLGPMKRQWIGFEHLGRTIPVSITQPEPETPDYAVAHVGDVVTIDSPTPGPNGVVVEVLAGYDKEVFGDVRVKWPDDGGLGIFRLRSLRLVEPNQEPGDTPQPVIAEPNIFPVGTGVVMIDTPGSHGTVIHIIDSAEYPYVVVWDDDTCDTYRANILALDIPDYHIGQRVKTPDGLVGTVTAVDLVTVEWDLTNGGTVTTTQTPAETDDPPTLREYPC